MLKNLDAAVAKWADRKSWNSVMVRVDIVPDTNDRIVSLRLVAALWLRL